MRHDKFAHQAYNPRDKSGLGKRSVREPSIVGHIDEIGVRPGGGDFTIDRDPAEAGIENEDRRMGRH
jgi:hypothetical protein